MTSDELKTLYDSFVCEPVGDETLDEMFNYEGAVYYRFLYSVSRYLRPRTTVELGVLFGRSTSHLAAGHPDGTVFGIDIDQRHLPQIPACFPNIQFIQGDSRSREVLDQFTEHSVDLCFFDTVHDGAFLLEEVAAWLPKMRPGAVLLFDDIHMFPSMTEAWNSLPLSRVEMPLLHQTGFGGAIVPP